MDTDLTLRYIGSSQEHSYDFINPKKMKIWLIMINNILMQ